MARDYKSKGGTGRRKTRKTSTSKSDATSPFKLLLAGFSAGVIAAAAAYYLLTPAPPVRRDAPSAEVQPRSIAEDEDSAFGGTDAPAPTAVASTGRAPAAQTGTPPNVASEPAAEPEPGADDGKKKYPFWRWLENYEVILPEDNERLENTTPVEQVTREGTYLLQVGAFNRFEDADRLKAQLAFIGIETHIQRVTLDDRQLHRVRIGPETALAEVNRLRRRLAEQDIDVMVIRMAP